MKIHIVKKGDTLYELAKKYQTTLDQIISLNPQIADPNHIDVGMKVKIPSAAKPVDPPASDFVYKHVVQQGDTLWKLGKAWDVPLQDMIKANTHLKNPNVLMTGDIVYVPKMQHGHGHGQTHGGHHQAHHTTKLSTEPFAPEPMTQPAAPMETYQQPIIPSPVMPQVEEAPPLSTGETMPAQPQMIPQAPMSMPVIPQPDLQEPYGQAVHPFLQFHIQATEVSAYPEQHHEAMTYPAYSPYQEEPCEPLPTMMPPVSAVDEGCGCGGPAINEHPWMNYPANYPNMPMGNPWDNAGPDMHAMPAFYPPAMPYDHQMAQHYAYQHDPYGIPYAGDLHQAHYESPILPQVHTHELKKVTDTQAELEIDIRDKQNAAKPKSGSTRSTRKVKLSGASALSQFLQQQGRVSEKRENNRTNAPWINL